MQHEDALRTQAAERYLLGEMSPEERDDYEDHYFSCEVCGHELSVTAALVANAREALTAPPPVRVDQRDTGGGAVRPGVGSRWKRLFATSQVLVPALGVAVVVLAGLVGYQRLAVIPELRQQLAERDAAQPVPTVALRSAARGSGPRLQVGPSDAFAVLQADVFPERAVTTYTATLVNADGEQLRTSLDAPEIGMPVTLLIPVRDLTPGEYTLIVQDDPAGSEAGRFSFSLERQ